MSLTPYYVLTILVLLTPTMHAAEHSLIAGLNVFHVSESRYRDYRQPTSDTGELRGGFWVSEYPIEKMNEGLGNNKLIGLYVKHRNHSATLVTYRNSYYQTEHPDRSWGLSINLLDHYRVCIYS